MLGRERGKSQNLRPTQGKWSSTTLDGPQQLRCRQAQARAHKNNLVLLRMPDQGNKLERIPYLTPG
jgi:hypothetical protein